MLRQPKKKKESAICRTALAEAQSEVGSVQWAALKARPDVASIATIAASIQTRSPDDANRLMQGTWKYLAKAKNRCMVIAPDMETVKEAQTVCVC